MTTQGATATRAVGTNTRAGPATTVLFTVTAFTGAGLLFVVQPLVARILLPAYGGSATVWSTASLFFQLVLLASYVWAHWSISRWGHRWQPRLQLVLLLVPVLVLPIALPAGSAPDGDLDPVWWLLRTLALMIGLPFAVVACTGPLVQSWYSWVGSRGDDPYFLFAASNLGSFVGLLAYPFLVEPHLSLAAQRVAWSVGFGVYAVLMSVCAVTAMRGRAPGSLPTAPSTPRPGPRRILLWGVLAFVPSALLLAVTAHLSTDVSPIPLLWVVPLAVYLGTFVVAFARSSREVPVWPTRLAAGLAVVALLGAGQASDLWLPVGINVALLAATAYAAHARLAADRPAPEHLTLFYLVVAAGGAAGGLLNGLVAPLVLDRVLEYPLLLIALPLLLLGTVSRERALLRRRYPAVLVAALLLAITAAAVAGSATLLERVTGTVTSVLAVAAVVGFGCLLARNPVALAVALLAIAVGSGQGQFVGTLEHTRSFFGAYRVQASDGQHVLVHGTTVHGLQFQDTERRDLPTTYYVSPGSCGDVFDLMRGRLHEVGVVGLGAGTMAAYGNAGERFTFFEIDADIAATAADPELFTFLADSRAETRVVVGDGRLKVAEQPAGTFDLLVLDAFSSDSIPVHLLTREAMHEYADALAPGGVLLVHTSNRFFDLEPVLAAAAVDLGWAASHGTGEGNAPGGTASNWVAITADPELTRRLQSTPSWRPLDLSRQVAWTDDYSSVLSVLE